MRINIISYNLKQILARTLGVVILSFPVLSNAADYPAPGNFQRGAKTWAENCGRCHNIRAANELRDDQWITTVYHMRVRAGLTGEEARDVLTFLQGSNTSVKVPATTTDSGSSKLTGKQVYNQTCVACHGGSGTGSFPGVPNLTKKDGPLAKSDDVLFKNIMGGFQSPGSPMAMPPKGGNPDLNTNDIRKTLDYMRKEFGK